MRSLLVQMDRAEERDTLRKLPLPASKLPPQVLLRLVEKELAYSDEGVVFPTPRGLKFKEE